MSIEKVSCRSCGETGMESILDLGITPLADRLLSEEMLKQHEPVHPLEGDPGQTLGYVVYQEPLRVQFPLENRLLQAP